MELRLLSTEFQVIKLKKNHLDLILKLCQKNPLYYEFCPPFPTKESIEEDMKRLPSKKTSFDKFYVGFFKENMLYAVMDFIVEYPNEKTVFIGFFMVNKEVQHRGVGSKIIEEACLAWKKRFAFVRLGYVQGNQQSESFWLKQGFEKTGIVVQEEKYSIVVLEKKLGG